MYSENERYSQGGTANNAMPIQKYFTSKVKFLCELLHLTKLEALDHVTRGTKPFLFNGVYSKVNQVSTAFDMI